MRLRVVSEKTEIPNLNPNEKMVHMAFRASNVDFLNLMQRCPRLRTIQIPHFLSEDNVQRHSAIPGNAGN